jgi:hypothetical protein
VAELTRQLHALGYYAELTVNGIPIPIKDEPSAALPIDPNAPIGPVDPNSPAFLPDPKTETEEKDDE